MNRKMNVKPIKAWVGLALAAITLGVAVTSQATTFLTTAYTNSFPIGTNTADFSGSGSVASWVYWYNTPGGNALMSCDVGMDAGNQTSSSGCLEMDSPFLGIPDTQNIIFGTFDNQYPYDFDVVANLINYSTISFDILVPPGTPADANGDFGAIQVGIIDFNQDYESFASPTIPGAASNGWVHIVVPIDQTMPNLNMVPGLAFGIENSGGYPDFNFTNYIDNVQLNLASAPPPPPVMAANLRPATPGLNEIATQAGQPTYRYQVQTVNNYGLGFLDQPVVTYAWNIQAFPNASPFTFQQYFIIAGGIPGPYDQGVDYALTNVIFITIQADANGQGYFDLSFKTNEPEGNDMYYNAVSPADIADNPNGWPIMPLATLISPSPVGNWSITFSAITNVTVTGPGGVSTNFVFDAASAQLFQDPLTLVLGAQPNDASGYGQGLVFGSFAVSGNDAPFTDQFTNDLTLDPTVWQDFSDDPNGDILVPPGGFDWLNWSLPDSGFTLQTAATLTGGPLSWEDLNPVTIQNNGSRQALLPVSSLLDPRQGYFRLIQRVATQLQVLLPGETNAPNTVTGKGGTPAVEAVGSLFPVTVNLVDATWHIVTSSDSISLTSGTDPTGGSQTGTLSGGTVQIDYGFDTAGSQTITASDTTSTNILSNTSSSVTAQ